MVYLGGKWNSALCLCRDPHSKETCKNSRRCKISRSGREVKHSGSKRGCKNDKRIYHVDRNFWRSKGGGEKVYRDGDGRLVCEEKNTHYDMG